MSATPLPSHPAAALSGAGLSGAARAVMPALASAAARTGVAFDALFQTARLESGFNPSARATTSSATGMFQFVEGTWLSTLARHGARHGITAGSRSEALALRRNPEIASLMAAEHMADNAKALQARLGRAAGTVDLYLAHFLGAGGAARFLERLAEAPGAAAASLLPKAAAANRSIFFDKGEPRSLQQVFDLFANRLGAGSDPAGRNAASPVRFRSVPGAGAVARPDPLQSALPADNAALPPAHAARLAYLLLADLGA